jgi:alpha-tubulin suppressor-like RCC1 family protein
MLPFLDKYPFFRYPNLAKTKEQTMSNVPVPFYYNSFTAKEQSYVDYMGNLHNSINSAIEENADRQIAANALFSSEIQSTLISNQIATETALYNHTQQLDSTLKSGFSDVSRQLGDMGSAMTMGLASLNRSVQESSKAICDKLDAINDTLKNPLYTQARELYNRAFQNYNKELYEEALEDLQEAIAKNKTDPFSHLLLGQTYLYGISEFSKVIDLNAAIDAFRNAAKYITPEAKAHHVLCPAAAEIWFFLGLAYQTKANDDLHNANKTEYENNLNEAKNAYGKSWDYSNKMLESLYNRARCKALTSEEDGAIQDLKEVVLQDHGYCFKVYTDPDFGDALKDKFFSHLKRELYPKAKAAFNRIEVKRIEFRGPYSNNLSQLINLHLSATLTENMPPFDMLEASENLLQVFTILEEEEQNTKQKRYNTCISASNSHIVGLKTDGTVVAVGNNEDGLRNTDKWRNIVAVSGSGFRGHTVGLKADGTVVAVGNNEKGQCNTGDWRNIVAVASGDSHTVGLKADGTVVAVGRNNFGECNTGDWRNIVAVVTGDSQTVGLKADGTVVAVGNVGNTNSWRDIVAVSASGPVGLKADGTVVAVGGNPYGQCNTGDWHKIVAVSAGGSHTVGLKADGTVVAVGLNGYGQCNTGDWRDIVAVITSSSHTVGLKSDGTVVAVGNNEKGQCNTGDWCDIVAVVTGGSHTVGLKKDGTVVAVGNVSNTSSWHNIGPIDKEKIKERIEAEHRRSEEDKRRREEEMCNRFEEEGRKRKEEERKSKEEEQRRKDQSNQWASQGLCRHCGGQMGGLFTKKCKSCGREQ